MKHKVIAITGNTATGTTSLTRRLSEIYGWLPVYSEEYLKTSPFYRNFLQDQRRWAFHNQAFFLGEYISCYRSAISSVECSDRVVCFDYGIFELAVYSGAMKDTGALTSSEYDILCRILDLILPTLPLPDLLVHLTTDIDVIATRLKERNRSCEALIDASYLSALDENFRDFVGSWKYSKVLQFDSGKVDFVNDDEALHKLGAEIEHQISQV
jgi:deoxyadenosine/deoxycytidine kinase